MAALLKRVAAIAAIDRAVAFALVGRTLSLLAGPVTVILIATYFTPELQGFHYTFASLLALQSFVELGFYIVIVNIASHEWAHLGLDPGGRVIGDVDSMSRLFSLGRLVFKWYAVASLLFVTIVGPVGYEFFSRSPGQNVSWQVQWLTLVVVSGLQLLVMPFVALLEGCNQVVTVNQFRLFQTVAGSLAIWTALWNGWGLWAAVVLAVVRLSSDLSLLLVRYRHFFAAFRQPPSTASLSWQHDIWPMQWRLALSGVVNYFAFSLFNPVMFYYHGPAVAGQMGMTWQAIGSLQSIAMVWITTRVPAFGILIAKRDYPALNRVWLRTSIVSLVILTAGALALWSLVFGLNVLHHPLAARLLGPLPTGLFLIAALLMQISQCQTAYMRAHRKEPIVVLSVTMSVAAGVSVWLAGRAYGPIGATTGYLAVMVGLVIWETFIWRRFRSLAIEQSTSSPSLAV